MALPEYIANKSTPGGNYTDSTMTDEEAQERLNNWSGYIQAQRQWSTAYSAQADSETQTPAEGSNTQPASNTQSVGSASDAQYGSFNSGNQTLLLVGAAALIALVVIR